MGLAFSQRISERSALGSGTHVIEAGRRPEGQMTEVRPQAGRRPEGQMTEVRPQAARRPAEPLPDWGASGPSSGSIDVRFDDEEDDADVDEWTLTRECVVDLESAAGHQPWPLPRALIRREDCTRVLSDEHAEWMGATPVLAMPIAEIHALGIARLALDVLPLIDGYSSLAAILGQSSRPTWQTILAFDELVARGAVVFLLLDEPA
jgi:hypothetical protein